MLDGSHIRTLLMTFFFPGRCRARWPRGTYVAQPLLGMIATRRTVGIQSDTEMSEILIQNGLASACLCWRGGRRGVDPVDQSRNVDVDHLD